LSSRCACFPSGQELIHHALDGAPEGSYVVLFVALKHSLLGRQQGYHEPDALQNRYNDPDKNAANPEFKVDVKPPGKTDYNFDLKLAGTDPGSPGGEIDYQFQLTQSAWQRDAPHSGALMRPRRVPSTAGKRGNPTNDRSLAS
jgi:hypothetical protein